MRRMHFYSLHQRKSLGILKQILDDFSIPNDAYSIGFPAEQRVCIETDNYKYCVYIMERGIRYEETFYTNVKQAHLAFLNQLASSDKEYAEMCQEYNNLYSLLQDWCSSIRRYPRLAHMHPTTNRPRNAPLCRFSKKSKKTPKW